MRVELEIWRQDGPTSEGRFETHVVTDATPEMSLLELLDRLNDQLAEQGLEPISFESDCREEVCKACGGCLMLETIKISVKVRCSLSLDRNL